jgi:hypothetical protein
LYWKETQTHKHTNTHTHAHTHTHTHPDTYTQTRRRRRTHTHRHAHTPSLNHTHTPRHIYTYSFVCVGVYTNISDIDKMNKAKSITKLRDSLIECMNKSISILRGQTFMEKLTIWGRFHKTFFCETYACNLGQNLRQYGQKSFIKLATGIILTTLHFL